MALITGASSGLGKALAIALGKRNIPLILAGRNRSALEELSKELDAPPTLCVSDLEKSEGRAQLLKLIHEKAPDLIINNAGSGLYGDALDHPASEELSILKLNCEALLELSLEGTRALIKQKKKGTIVNISSVAAFLSYPKSCVYAASKAFVKQFSEGFAEEVKEYGIRVLTACPGQIQTDFQRRAGGLHRHHLLSMPVEKAVEHLLLQIDRQKRVYVFDWRYRALLLFCKLLPRSLIHRILKREIRHRISS